VANPKTGRPARGEGEPGPESVLTPEERRALLSPAPAAEGYPVLVLAPGPDQLSSLADSLRDRGLAVIPALNCFAALDRFRRQPYAGFVAFAASLPPDVGWYLGRLRGVNPGVRICLIRDGRAEPLPAGVAAVGPGLPGEELDRLVAFLGVASLPEARKGVAGETRGAGGQRPFFPASLEAEPPDTPPSGELRPPDPFLAIRLLWEARLEGRPMEDGLLRWAGEDPAVRGWVDQRDQGGELQLRAAADTGEDRAGMLTALLDRLGSLGERVVEPTALGPFGIFPRGEGEDGWVALWHREDAAAAHMVRGLHGLAPLLASVREGTPVPCGRERFVSLLGSRMRAAERRGGRLGLLLFAPGGDGEVARLSKMLRALLRGGDWVEPLGDRVVVILEEPERRVFSALGARLRELPGVDGLRVVALAWTPLEGSSARFLEKAEELLESGDHGEGIPGLAG
jgi:hypothetical protein